MVAVGTLGRSFGISLSRSNVACNQRMARNPLCVGFTGHRGTHMDNTTIYTMCLMEYYSEKRVLKPGDLHRLTQTPGTLACYRGRIQEPRIEDATKVALRVSTFLGILFATRNFKLTPSEADPIDPPLGLLRPSLITTCPNKHKRSNIQVRTRRYSSSTLYLIAISISSVPDIPPVSSFSSNLCRCRCSSRGLPRYSFIFIGPTHSLTHLSLLCSGPTLCYLEWTRAHRY